MRLCRRNLTCMEYRAYLGKQEKLKDGKHTGQFVDTYADPVTYEGNMSTASGFAADKLFGINVDYTHVLMLPQTDPEIDEAGLFDWRGHTYFVQAVHPGLNHTTVALKRKSADPKRE